VLAARVLQNHVLRIGEETMAKKIKLMIHACPACGEKEHGKGTGLEFVAVDEADGKTILECTACGWTGKKAECVATEKVEGEQ
jgi:predicted RNA-binding Zn-ribbon protein involved in translation (DUF1610 family)